MTRAFLLILAASQLVLGLLCLALPVSFATWMGLTPPAPDSAYLMAMLGARFTVSGLALAALKPNRPLLGLTALVQAVDFTAGALLLASGTISLATAAFPMANAALFTLGLLGCLRLSPLA